MGYLVLEARAGDAIWIGEIRMQVDVVRSGRVRLLFSGPRQISIDRETVRESRRAEREGKGDGK